MSGPRDSKAHWINLSNCFEDAKIFYNIKLIWQSVSNYSQNSVSAFTVLYNLLNAYWGYLVIDVYLRTRWVSGKTSTRPLFKKH